MDKREARDTQTSPDSCSRRNPRIRGVFPAVDGATDDVDAANLCAVSPITPHLAHEAPGTGASRRLPHAGARPYWNFSRLPRSQLCRTGCTALQHALSSQRVGAFSWRTKARTTSERARERGGEARYFKSSSRRRLADQWMATNQLRLAGIRVLPSPSSDRLSGDGAGSSREGHAA